MNIAARFLVSFAYNSHGWTDAKDSFQLGMIDIQLYISSNANEPKKNCTCCISIIIRRKFSE